MSGGIVDDVLAVLTLTTSISETGVSARIIHIHCSTVHRVQ